MAGGSSRYRPGPGRSASPGRSSPDEDEGRGRSRAPRSSPRSGRRRGRTVDQDGGRASPSPPPPLRSKSSGGGGGGAAERRRSRNRSARRRRRRRSSRSENNDSNSLLDRDALDYGYEYDDADGLGDDADDLRGCVEFHARTIRSQLRNQLEIEKESYAAQRVREGCVVPASSALRETVEFIRVAAGDFDRDAPIYRTATEDTDDVIGLNDRGNKGEDDEGVDHGPDADFFHRAPTPKTGTSGGDGRDRGGAYDVDGGVVDGGGGDNDFLPETRYPTNNASIQNELIEAIAEAEVEKARMRRERRERENREARRREESRLFQREVEEQHGEIMCLLDEDTTNASPGLNGSLGASHESPGGGGGGGTAAGSQRRRQDRNEQPKTIEFVAADGGCAGSPRGVDSPDKCMLAQQQHHHQQQHYHARQPPSLPETPGGVPTVFSGTSDVDVADAAGGGQPGEPTAPGAAMGAVSAAVATAAASADGAVPTSPPPPPHDEIRSLRLSLFQTDEGSAGEPRRSRSHRHRSGSVSDCFDSDDDGSDARTVPLSRLKRAMGELVLQDDVIESLLVDTHRFKLRALQDMCDRVSEELREKAKEEERLGEQRRRADQLRERAEGRKEEELARLRQLIVMSEFCVKASEKS